QLLGAVITAQALERAAHPFQPRIHSLKMIQQLTDCTGDRIGHVLADAVSVETQLLGDGFALGFYIITGLDDDPPRNTHRSRASRHSLGDDSVGTNLGTGTHSERAEHLGARPHYDTI